MPIPVQDFQAHLLDDSVAPWPGEVVGQDGDAVTVLTFLSGGPELGVECGEGREGAEKGALVSLARP